MPNNASRQSLIQEIMDYNLKRPGGLDYAAYALAQGPELVIERLITSSNDRQLADLLRRLACTGRTPAKQIELWNQLLPTTHRAMCELDRAFATTGQGENVRIVFDVDMGGFFYTRLGSHAVLFGATLDQAQVNNGRCEQVMRSIVSQIEAKCTAHGA
jgi:hypothetical protein